MRQTAESSIEVASISTLIKAFEAYPDPCSAFVFSTGSLLHCWPHLISLDNFVACLASQILSFPAAKLADYK
jgi:hypothetical protein